MSLILAIPFPVGPIVAVVLRLPISPWVEWVAVLYGATGVYESNMPSMIV